MKPKYISLLMTIILLICAFPATAQDDLPTWTIIFYAAADTDLEEPMLLDVNELEWVGSTDDIHIVVQMDRAEGYTDADGDWTEARRFYLTQDQDPHVINSEVVMSLGEIFQSDPAEIVDFVTWAIENYPAEKYALFFSDHGGGVMGGFGNDDSEDGAPIYPMQIDQALAEITSATGITFEIIGFDACLMAQLDIARVLAPYSNYALFAEELEPGYGWSFDTSIGILAENPDVDGATLGKIIVDTYMQFYTEIVTSYDKFDLNVVDLSQIPNIDAPMANFIQAVQANGVDVLRAIGAARNNVQFFGGATPDEADKIASVDLLHFLKLLVKLTNNTEVAAAATDLIGAVESTIVYHQANDALPNANGMSIFFPRNARLYNESGAAEYYNILVPQMTDWQIFLETFYSVAVETLPPIEPDVKEVVKINEVYPTDESSIHNPPTIMFTTDGANVTSISFSATLDLGDGVYITLDQAPLESATYTEDGEQIIDYADGVQDHVFTWGADMPVVTDGLVDEIPVLLLSTGDPETVAVSGVYTSADKTVEAFLHFSLETQEVKQVWGVTPPGPTSTSGAPFEIRPKAGDTFIPTWRFFDEAGNIEIYIPEVAPLTFGDSPFIFDYLPADSGNYILTIMIEDMAGNLYSDDIMITVNNEDIDMTYRGYNEINFGISYPYFWDWMEPYDIETETGDTIGVTGNFEGTISLYLNYYAVDSSEAMLDALMEYIEATEGSEYDEPETITLGGYEGQLVNYYFEQDDGAYLGMAMAVYVPENETGYLIDVEIQEGAEAEEEGYAVIDALINTISFFPPITSGGSAPDSEGVEAKNESAEEFTDALSVFIVAGYTEEEAIAFLAEDDMTLDDVQSMVDNGEITLEEIYEILMDESK